MSGLLPQFCGVGIEWRSAGARYASRAVSPAELEALAAVPGVRALNTQTRPNASAEQLEWLLRQPGLRGLTDLRCAAGQLDDAATQTLAKCCPQLSTLVLSGPSSSAWPPLHLLPALTDPSVTGDLAVGTALVQLSLCAGSRRLSVLVDNTGPVGAVQLSSALRALELLHLTALHLRFINGLHPVARLDWAAAFATLSALQSLSLTRPPAVDALLGAVGAGCVQLHSLRIRLGWLTDSEGRNVPTAGALATLLGRLPSLRSLSLCMPTLAGFIDGADAAEIELKTNDWHRLHGNLAAFVATHLHRATLLLE